MAIKSLAQTLKGLATGIKNTVTDITSSNATLTITKGNGTTSTVTVNNALKANGHTVNADVPANAKFTDTTYGTVTDSESGLMTAAQKQKLDELSNYSLPVASATTLGGVKVGDGLTITDGVLSSGVTGGNATHGEKLFTANDTFVVPEGVSTLVVTAVGGGGGGGGGGREPSSNSGRVGGQGNRGNVTSAVPVCVSPSQSIPVVVGQGGAGGIAQGAAGAGGAGNPSGSNGAGPRGGYGGNGGNGGSKNGLAGTGGGGGVETTTAHYGAAGGGGGGGATSFGEYVFASGGGGGGGAGHSTGGAGAAAANIVYDWKISHAYGAGGAGGAAFSGNGGNGASGCVYIIW